MPDGAWLESEICWFLPLSNVMADKHKRVESWFVPWDLVGEIGKVIHAL